MKENNFDILSLPDSESYQLASNCGGWLANGSIGTIGMMPLVALTPTSTIDHRLSDSADLIIGGQSLRKFIESTHDSLQDISERINLLSVNPQLEQEWKELAELGHRYRQLEKEILEKQQIWNQLKS
jgi:CII-binding regulator of phage lambda lysogenization HflD